MMSPGGPVYPVFVAVAGSAAMAKFLQALLDTGTCVLVFLIARRNWKAAALWAVYPFAIWRVGFISKEVVATFLLAAYVGMQLLALRNGKMRAWLAAGGLLALVNLCKPTFLAWPIAILALAFLHRVPLLAGRRIVGRDGGRDRAVDLAELCRDARRVSPRGHRAGRSHDVYRELSADAWPVGGAGQTNLVASHGGDQTTTCRRVSGRT